MGLTQTRNEDQLSQMIKQDYITQTNQHLLHKKSQQPCTLHKITTTSRGESSLIDRNITAYQQSKCKSISKLREHYHIDSGGYCSDDESFYLIFQGQTTPSVREEYLARRYAGKGFKAVEIQNILGAMLCGLKQYCKKFGRKDCKVGLETIGINIFNKNQLYLKQPWLAQKHLTSSQASISFYTSYPSPQKLQSAITITSDYDEFRSDLFTVGMNGLELASMNFRDDVYITKKYVDRHRIMEQIACVREMRLRSGLEILLSENPQQREKIYQFWGLRCESEFYLPYLESLEKEKKIKQQINNQMHLHDAFRKPIRNPSTDNVYQIEPLNLKNIGRNTYNAVSSGRNTANTEVAQSLPYNPSTQRPKSQYIPKQQDTSPHTNLITHGYRPPSVDSKRPYINFAHSQTISQFPTPKLSIEAPSFDYRTPAFKPEPLNQFNRYKPINPIPYPVKTTSFSANNSFKEDNKTSSFQNGFSFSSSIPPITQFDDSKKYAINVKQPSPKKEYPTTEFNQSSENIINSPLKREKKSLIGELAQIDKPKQQPKNQQKVEIKPESPSTIELTPPPQSRPANKYNSTIVQVNEETPNDSESSDHSSPRKLEFVIEQYQTGSRYEGYKKNNVRNGRGKFYYQDGGYYDGEWKNNQMHGWGKLFYEGGKLAYEGNWAHDQFHGFGKVYNDNPIPLDSDAGFDYTNFDLLDDYWEYYEGMLAKDTKEGRGRIQLSNGETFEGDFHNDRIQGFGKFTKLDGVVIEGIWRDSRLIKVMNSG